uniref:Uncharacterized protein n=1 Tax=Populus alba TaxID=43335 RepID=A0A4U5Q0G8_POPAL|nr:hypothetical protein D5086_0000154270 [Populus alba]
MGHGKRQVPAKCFNDAIVRGSICYGFVFCSPWPLELLRRWAKLLAALRRRNGQIGGGEVAAERGCLRCCLGADPWWSEKMMGAALWWRRSWMKTANESGGGWLRWVSLLVLLLREEGAAERERVLVTSGCGGRGRGGRSNGGGSGVLGRV